VRYAAPCVAGMGYEGAGTSLVSTPFQQGVQRTGNLSSAAIALPCGLRGVDFVWNGRSEIALFEAKDFRFGSLVTL